MESEVEAKGAPKPVSAALQKKTSAKPKSDFSMLDKKIESLNKPDFPMLDRKIASLNNKTKEAQKLTNLSLQEKKEVSPKIVKPIISADSLDSKTPNAESDIISLAGVKNKLP